MNLTCMISFIMIICSHQLICSNDYKIVGLQKESVCGFVDTIEDGVIQSVPLKKTFYLVEIPLYDTQNGFFLERKPRWVSLEDYEKVVQIIHKKNDDTTLFPIQLTDYYDHGILVEDALRWVPAHQKKMIEQIAADNKRKQAEADELTRIARVRSMSLSLFGRQSSQK